MIDSSLANPAVFEVNDVTHHFRRRAQRALFDSLSFAAYEGQFIAICGPSGSGKTTLMQLLSALTKPSSGTIQFEGTDIHSLRGNRLSEVRRRLGVVCQNVQLMNQYTTLENVLYALMPQELSRTDRLARANEWLDAFELDQCTDQRSFLLSGGERQRLAIVRALAGNPACLLADEPTSHLDDRLAEVTIEAIRQLSHNGQTAIVFTHDDRISNTADVVYTIREKGLHRE